MATKGVPVPQQSPMNPQPPTSTGVWAQNAPLKSASTSARARPGRWRTRSPYAARRSSTTRVSPSPTNTASRTGVCSRTRGIVSASSDVFLKLEKAPTYTRRPGSRSGAGSYAESSLHQGTCHTGAPPCESASRYGASPGLAVMIPATRRQSQRQKDEPHVGTPRNGHKSRTRRPPK